MLSLRVLQSKFAAGSKAALISRSSSFSSTTSSTTTSSSSTRGIPAAASVTASAWNGLRSGRQFVTPSASFATVAEAEPEFSKYEYPTRKEAPIITRTLPSKEHLATSPRTSSEPKVANYDPFDDSCSLNHEQISSVLEKQREEHSALLSSMSSLPITQEVPSFIPPNFPSQELKAPETFITTLSNGVRVVSQETYGQMCTVGVVTNAGSRHEKVQGTAHLLESLAFSSTTQFPDATVVPQLLQDWGATQFVSSSREQFLYCIDVLRPNADKAFHLLSQVILEPKLDEMEVEQSKFLLSLQAEEPMPELILGEALQTAAYGAEQQLGRPHFATEENIPHLNVDVVKQFWTDNIKNNPEGFVVAGAGIDHAQLVDMATNYFGSMTQQSSPETIPSTYRGGYHSIAPIITPEKLAMQEELAKTEGDSMMPSPEDYCRVAMAFPIGGWHSKHELVTACVLQSLLGGGSSFSAGGPGKGMYTRMYRQVLNKYAWVETAEAFTSFSDEEGLLGVSGSTTSPDMVSTMLVTLLSQLVSLATAQVSDEELVRARNMLKCMVLTQLESRIILFEDLGRQVLTYGRREDAHTTCERIDSVTAQDIQQLALKFLQSDPTIASTGKYLDRVPEYSEVMRWMQR